MDFAAELQKLLDAEDPIPLDPLAEIVATQGGLWNFLQKNSSGLSMQIEEIYDIIKDADQNAKEAKAAIKREYILLGSLIAISDLLDGLLPYLHEHNQTISAKKEEVLKACGLERLGFPGERLDPRLHTVAAAEYNEAAFETIIHVLESGYTYRGQIIRKATVILSKGAYDQ
jgi:molecular chaperone GrpE (heat shock protein)